MRGLRHVEAAQPDEDRIAHGPYLREGLPGRGRDAHGGVRSLVGFGDDGQVVEGIVFPLIGEAILCPGLEDDVETLLEAFPALRVRDAVALIGPGETAAPDAEVEAALA